MARGNERAFLARILRESVLTLCREAMDSHRRFIVDGIVCISLEDDNSGSDCSPIVVTIHEQLPKMCKGDYSTSPQRQSSPPCDGPTTLVCPRPAESETEEGRVKRPDVPLDKKNNILRRVQQAEAENTTGNSVHSPAPPRLTSPCRSASEPLADKMPGLREDREDGHVSDPTPMAVRSLVRHSLSQCSEGSEKGEVGRGSVSSPASSDLSSSTHEDVSPVGRAGSASPQDDFSLPVNGFSSPAVVLSRYCRGNLGLHSRREVLHCQRCGHGFPNAFSLERHNRQKHSLFTCNHCLATFTTRSSLDSHACLHLTKSARRNGAQVLSRRDYRQRYMAVSQPRIRRRVSERYNFSPYVGKRPGDVKRNFLTQLGRCVSASSRALTYSSRKGYFCSSCAVTFSDPVSYTAHVKCHSQDPDFHQYRCCYCTAVLENYQAFKLHQQVHALQLQQPAYEFLQYQGRLRDTAHLPTQAGQPGDTAQRSQAEEGRFNGSVQRGLEKTHTKEEESKTQEKTTKEDVDQMEHEDSGSGPRQSWCTECHVGFPDENTLLLHITDTHEALIRRQPSREASPPHAEGSRHHPMDTSHSAVEHPSGDEDGHASKTRTEQMEQGDTEENQTSLPVSVKSFPLRVIPIPLPLDQKAREGSSKNASLITLVKPNDLIIRSEPYPHHTSAIDFHNSTPESGLDLTTSQKRSPTKAAYSLLNGVLHSGSYVNPSEQKNGIKQELESDPENLPLGETLMSPLRMLLPHNGLAFSVSESSRHSPDLPQNLSMPRVSSGASSRAAPADSAKSVVSLDKVLTPEVPFHARSPVKCPMQDCSEEFPSFPELEEHSARVHRRCLCSYCGKSFTAKPNRERHVRVHTGVKPYKCQVCGQAFHRGDDLKYHVTTKHPRDTESF